MVSASIAGVLRSHGGFVEAIYRACGSRSFTQSNLSVAGVTVPADCTLQKLHSRGVVERAGKDHRFANTWRLSPQVVDYYADYAARQGVSA